MMPASKERTVYGFNNSSHGEALVRPGYSTMAVTATKAAITGIQGHCLCVEKKTRINISFVAEDTNYLTPLVLVTPRIFPI